MLFPIEKRVFPPHLNEQYHTEKNSETSNTQQELFLKTQLNKAYWDKGLTFLKETISEKAF